MHGQKEAIRQAARQDHAKGRKRAGGQDKIKEQGKDKNQDCHPPCQKGPAKSGDAKGDGPC
jgi:hypothetical protein